MRFDDAFLDELKSRLRLSELIGKTVKLKRQGREYVGLSPFSKERTPSFFVNDDKGRYFDFSAGKDGDAITFLQETERLSFVEAVEKLAAAAGMALPAPDPRAAETEKKLASLSDWLETAAAWFEAELRRPGGREARSYLEGRGLPEADWKRFRLGFAPSGRTALKDYLVAKGATPGALIETGLLIAPEDGGAPYDRFRGRIMFPIEGARGRIVSFGGRALDPQAHAKYLNGPETSLFHKGRVLYGLPEARRLLHAGGEAAPLVVVEGYMDVIACQRAGVAAVASMGTALTEEQMEALWRLHPEPTLCFDGDRAGRAAASRAADRFLPMLGPRRSVQIALLSEKDPDDIFRSKGGEALREAIQTTTGIGRFLLDREVAAQDLQTAEHLIALKGRLRQLAASIKDVEFRKTYAEQFREAVDVWWKDKWEKGEVKRRGARDIRQGGPSAWNPSPSRPRDVTRDAARQLAREVEPLPAALASRAVLDPGVLDPHLEALQARGLGDPTLGDLVSEIIRLRLEAEHLDTGALQRHLAARGFSALLNDIDRAAAKSGAPFIQSDVTLAAARSQWTHAFSAMNRLAALEDAMDAAKRELAAGVGADRFMALKTERDSLRRALKTGAIWNEDGAN